MVLSCFLITIFVLSLLTFCVCLCLYFFLCLSFGCAMSLLLSLFIHLCLHIFSVSAYLFACLSVCIGVENRKTIHSRQFKKAVDASNGSLSQRLVNVWKASLFSSRQPWGRSADGSQWPLSLSRPNPTAEPELQPSSAQSTSAYPRGHSLSQLIRKKAICPLLNPP